MRGMPSTPPHKKLIRMIAVSLSVSAAASSTALSSERGPPPLNLRVSAETRALLVPIDAPNYREAKLDSLFKQLRDRGDAYCSMVHAFDGAERDRSVATRYLRQGPQFRRYWRACPNCPGNVRLGCWNYYRTNDRDIDVMFETVKKFSGFEAPQCFSVGLTQPYEMHNRLGCSTLTIVDYSWRIQDAHRQVLDKVRAGRFVDEKSVNRALRDVVIGWSHRKDATLPSFQARLEDLCGVREGRRACAQRFVEFQRGWAQLKRVELFLGSLHEVPIQEDSQSKVLFFSNAMDRRYTSDPEIESMLTRLTKSLQPQQEIVLVHHAAGSGRFGIYSLSKSADGMTLTARCRDEYPSPPKVGTSPTYTISLDDRIDNLGEAPPCSATASDRVGSDIAHTERQGR